MRHLYTKNKGVKKVMQIFINNKNIFFKIILIDLDITLLLLHCNDKAYYALH